MLKRTLLAASLFLLPAMSTPSFASGVVNVATIGEPPTLDPMASTADVVGMITQHIFETLFTFDAEWNVVPLLAEGMPTVSADGKTYDIALGFQPVGHKQFEGDGKTPEGLYFIDRFNPRSRYHLSVGISYPNDQDKAYAAQFGRSAGSDIMFHGRGPEGNALAPRNLDWTAGCLALTDQEIEDVYAMLQPGIPVMLYA